MAILPIPGSEGMPISFGIERAIIDHLSQTPEPTSEQFLSAVEHAFSLVYPKPAVRRQLESLAHAVEQHIAQYQKKETGSSPVRPGKSMGSQYANWLSELDAESVCLLLANYDTEVASRMYWLTSVNTMKAAVRLRAEHDSQQMLAQFEATMYGMGGKYSDDDGSAVVHDLNSAEGQAALKQFGF